MGAGGGSANRFVILATSTLPVQILSKRRTRSADMTITALNLTPIQGGELHPSVVDRLDPEYVKFYNETYVGRAQVQELPPSTFKM